MSYSSLVWPLDPGEAGHARKSGGSGLVDRSGIQSPKAWPVGATGQVVGL